MHYAPHIFSQQNGNLLNATQVCASLYKKETSFTKIASLYHYIYGDNGVVAIYMATRTGRDTILWEEMEGLEGKGIVYTDSLYYIHTDHLGRYSINPNLQEWCQEIESARGRQQWAGL